MRKNVERKAHALYTDAACFERVFMKRSIIIFILFSVITAGCSGGVGKTYGLLYHLLAADPVTVMALAPADLTVLNVYDQFDRMEYRSKSIPIALRSEEKHWAEIFAVELKKNFDTFSLDRALAGSSFIQTYNYDPQKLEKENFGMLIPFKTVNLPDNLFSETIRYRKYEKPPQPVAVNSSSDYWLVEILRTFGNEKKKRFFRIDYRSIKKSTKAPFLFLISLDSINAIDRQVSTEIELYFSIRIISLKYRSYPLEIKKLEKVVLPGSVKNVEENIPILKTELERVIKVLAEDFSASCRTSAQ